MKTLFKNLLCILGASLFLVSCNNDDDGDDLDREAEARIECEQAISDSKGTVCCTLGAATASPGDLKTYEYNNNFNFIDVEWEILSGDITIVSEDDTFATAEVSFGPNFTGGTIKARAQDGNNGPACSDSWEITVD
ncbi:hypothetical protein [Croceiramulus getboli]|nr:hypothetical protein P8624_07315 [Flavobacteriaceae bacterium YJPT1-3]